MRRDENIRECCRIDPRQVLRNGHQRERIRDHIFRLTASAMTHDPVSLAPAADAVANFRYFPGEFDTRGNDVAGAKLASLVDLATIQAGRPHFDQNLSGTDLRNGNVLDLDLAAVRRRYYAYCFHYCLLR